MFCNSIIISCKNCNNKVVVPYIKDNGYIKVSQKCLCCKTINKLKFFIENTGFNYKCKLLEHI